MSQRVRLAWLNSNMLRKDKDFPTIRACIRWLKDHSTVVFKATRFSDYFRLHPERKAYIPNHRMYAIIKLNKEQTWIS